MNLSRLVVRAVSRLPKRSLRRIAGEPLVIDGRILDLQVQAFLAFGSKRSGKVDLTPKGLRKAFAEFASSAGGDPVRGVAVHDRTIPGPAGEIAVRLYHPSAASGEAPAIVWFHQGGGVIGDLDTDHALCTELADECGAVIVSIGYRLAPEHSFPAAVDDCISSYEWVVDNCEGLGIDPARVAVGGASIGASLAAVICQQRRGQGAPQPVLQILAYGDLNGTATGGSLESCADCLPLGTDTLSFFAHHYLPDGSAINDPRVSPGTASELWGLAPAVSVTAGFDPLRDVGDEYAAALLAAGVEVAYRCEDSLPHSFTMMGGVSREAREAIARLATDVADRLV